MKSRQRGKNKNGPAKAGPKSDRSEKPSLLNGAEGVVVHQELDALQTEHGVIFGALSLTEYPPDTQAEQKTLMRVYASHTFASENFAVHSVHPDGLEGLDRDLTPVHVSIIRGGAGMFIDCQPKTEIVRTLQTEGPHKPEKADLELADGGTVPVPLLRPRTELLAGLNCMFTHINNALAGQVYVGLAPGINLDADAGPLDKSSVPTVSDNPLAEPDEILSWLAFHCRHHEVNGALLLNRLGPNGQGRDFAARLAAALEARRTAANEDAQESTEDRRENDIFLAGLRRVVVLDIPVPVGRAERGDERHLANSPSAPGRGRMVPPPHDAWRAPLADDVLLDMCRPLYLARAGGVLNLDVSDYLAPLPQGVRPLFEAARLARPDAMIALGGRNAFPWQYVDDARPRPGDHICLPFDAKLGFRRWCAAPAEMPGKPQTWRPHRIMGLDPVALPGAVLWRFSGMRHPGFAPGQLVARSALQEHAELLEFVTTCFGTTPVRPPEPDIKKKAIGKSASEHDGKIVFVTAMKNEGPFLLEWIAYHRAIGVTNFVVFTNDCTDGTDRFLDLLAARGIVEHYDNPFRKMKLKPQHAGFRMAETLPTVRDADWLMASDVDEYLAIHCGKGRLKDLFNAIGDANLISCTWRLFGNSDISAYKDEFLLRQFTSCASKGASRPHQAWGFKTLYRNSGLFKKIGVHRPKGFQGSALEHLNWVNGSGKQMPLEEVRTAWRSNTNTIGYDLVSLNHYAVRSTESFLVKRDRGRVNHTERDQGAAYWFRMNHNTTQDHSIQRLIPALQDEWDRLMSDPEISAAHASCVAAHKAKIAELLTRPDQRAFRDMLDSDRFKTLSRILPAFGQNVFLAGPESVPEEIISKISAAPDPSLEYFTIEKPEDATH